MEWIKFLKASAYKKDKEIFNDWINSEISLYECIDMFKINNHIPADVYIHPAEFMTWLNGLGWVSEYM